MMLTFRESGHPVFRATSPLSRGQLKSKGGGKLSIHYCADQETISIVFRTSTSENQLSLYGAVVEMCEEYESFHDRTGKLVVVRQSSSSFVPSVIKTNVPEWNVIPGFSSLQILQKIHNDLRERNIEPEKFTDWIIRQHFFMWETVRQNADLDCFKIQIL